jgi:xeroderma pigmentosum group C-complementing protein
MVDKEDEAKYFERFERLDNIEAFRAAAKELKGSRDFGAQLFTALLRALGIETRLIFSLQPLGFNFGKQEDAHRLDRKKDDLNKEVQENVVDAPQTPPKKRKRQKMDDDDEDEEDLGLPKVKSKGNLVLDSIDMKPRVLIPI